MKWFGSRKGTERTVNAASSRLIADTEAFLSGGYASHLQRHCDEVPGWARLNRLAHGDLTSLHQSRGVLAATTSAFFADWPEENWRHAQQILATELLELVDNNPDKLARVQQNVLVPLELELIRIEEEHGLTVPELVQCTRSALRSSIA